MIEAQLSGGLMGVSDEHWSRISIAYEPVWAVGTSRTATRPKRSKRTPGSRYWLGRRASKRVADDMGILWGARSSRLTLLSCSPVRGSTARW